MIIREVSFSITAHVGDEELPQIIEGVIPVMLRDDPSEDECDLWRTKARRMTEGLPYGVLCDIERAAIKQARAWLAAEQADAQVERAMSREEER